MSDSDWNLLLKNPKLEWNKLSLASTRLKGPQNAIRQSHIYAILRRRSLAEVKTYVTWRLHLAAKTTTWEQEHDRSEHNKGSKDRKKRKKENDNDVVSKKGV